MAKPTFALNICATLKLIEYKAMYRPSKPILALDNANVLENEKIKI